MIRNATFARGSVTGVRGKNPMRVFWLGYARHMHGDLRAINGLLPTDLWSLQGHMRIFRRVERDKMSLIHGVLGALEPVAIFRAGADDALATLFEKQIVARQYRRGLRPDVRENESGDFLSFVRGMLDAVFEGAIGRFCRLLQAAPVHIIE